MNTVRMISLLLTLVGGSMAATHAGAQNVAVDEGSFRITLRGRPAGTETFSIRRAGTGADARVIARGEVQLELEEGLATMLPALEVSGPALTLTAYQVNVSGSREESIAIPLVGGRLVATMRTDRGERVREYRATPGTVVLEEGVAHHFFIVGARLDQGFTTLPIIVPRAAKQLQMTVTDVGREDVRVASSRVPARHLRLEGGRDSFDLWIDDQGRVLRVQNLATGYAAERQGLP